MDAMNFNLKLTGEWLFHLGELEALYIPVPLAHITSEAGGYLKEYDMFKEGTEWKEVTVPHDWATELPFDKSANPAEGFKKRGTAWYYKTFELDNKEIQSARLVFDGVLGKCDVFVNGVVAVRNFSGYNRFYAEIGDYLLPGEKNEIAVYVDARRWEGWWYEGAGIYRNAYIEFREYTHFDKEKCFVKTEKIRDSWKINTDLKIIDMAPDSEISVRLKDSQNNIIYKNISKKTSDCITVKNPHLWSPENPYIYTVEFELIKNGVVIDRFKTNVGFRHVEWKKNEGMFLNGEHYYVKGMCCHQDHAGVGAATTKEIMQYRISRLKEMGVNAYRCAHHAPDEQLLYICDKMGMLVMVENRHFSVSEDVFKQLDSLVYISRNHPSVFLYSLFNEEPWQQEERGRRIAEKMRERILENDNTRAIIGAQNGGVLEKSNTSDVLDLIGINYFLKDYEEAHKRTPDKVLIGTENAPSYATRGIYKSDKKEQVFACYGDEYPEFTETLEETMEICLKRPYVAGCFVWSGFDYRGEPTPFEWPSILSHWCYTDYCGFKKDIAYLLEAYYKDELTAHLLPHWNHSENDIVRVCVFTNATTAELFVNRKSVGKTEVSDRRAEWQVPFKKGEIKVIAEKDGKKVSDEVKTAQEPHSITLSDVTPFSEDGVHIINLCVTDVNKTVVPDFSEKVKFTLENLILLGVGNGNPNSMHGEKDMEINFFNGYAQIIVKGKNGKLKAKCENLPEAEINF